MNAFFKFNNDWLKFFPYEARSSIYMINDLYDKGENDSFSIL